MYNLLKIVVLGLLVSAFASFSLPVFAETFCFDEAGRTYGINPFLLQSIARVESGLNAKAVNINKNGSADLGLMQINSAWIEPLQLNRNKLLSDPCYNVKAGASILKACIDRWDYTWQAVGCYNAASKSKQVDYSWKIYRELRKEGARKKTMAKREGAATGSNSPGQSLHFKVRSIEGHESENHP